MRIFYDSEFVERGPAFPITLVSIGMVREDGKEYYAVNADLDTDLIRYHEWEEMRTAVWAQLSHFGDPENYELDLMHADVKWPDQIADEIRAFVLELDAPELWASYSDYDHVVLCQLFGTMAALPKGFPMLTRDVKDMSVRLGDPQWPEQREPAHHALHDARHARDVWKFLAAIEAGLEYGDRDTVADMDDGRMVEPGEHTVTGHGPVDLGHGHTLEFVAWKPDADLNPRYTGRYGAHVHHRTPDGRDCAGYVAFAGLPEQIAPGPPTWTVESWEPLTLSPSPLCRACGDHGFVRDGRWVPT